MTMIILGYILLGIATIIAFFGITLFVKYSISFFKLVKERDGYYFFKPRKKK